MTAAVTTQERLIYCSFCGDNQHEAAGLGVHICNKCVDICNEMVAEFREEKEGVKDEQPTELG